MLASTSLARRRRTDPVIHPRCVSPGEQCCARRSSHAAESFPSPRAASAHAASTRERMASVIGSRLGSVRLRAMRRTPAHALELLLHGSLRELSRLPTSSDEKLRTLAPKAKAKLARCADERTTLSYGARSVRARLDGPAERRAPLKGSRASTPRNCGGVPTLFRPPRSLRLSGPGVSEECAVFDERRGRFGRLGEGRNAGPSHGRGLA